MFDGARCARVAAAAAAGPPSHGLPLSLVQALPQLMQEQADRMRELHGQLLQVSVPWHHIAPHATHPRAIMVPWLNGFRGRESPLCDIGPSFTCASRISQCLAMRSGLDALRIYRALLDAVIGLQHHYQEGLPRRAYTAAHSGPYQHNFSLAKLDSCLKG